MKAVCTGPLIPNREGYSPGFTFPLVIGVAYNVRSMALIGSELALFVVGTDGWPNWYPAELFEVVDHHLPSGWLFATRAGVLSALWGYPSMVENPDHLADLRRRRGHARSAFLAESGVLGFDAATSRFIDSDLSGK